MINEQAIKMGKIPEKNLHLYPCLKIYCIFASMQTQNANITKYGRVQGLKKNIRKVSSTKFNESIPTQVRSFYVTFFLNNRYLLRIRNKTFYRQCKDFKEMYGCNLYKETINRLMSGDVYSCSFTYLYLFSKYHGVPVSDMLSINMEAEGYIPENLTSSEESQK